MASAFLAAPRVASELGEIRLAPHQVDAASRLLTMLDECGGAVLADATGLGKTFVAIAVARVRGPALVVVPAALRTMWRESLGRSGVIARIESYEALSRDEASDGARPALVILDEAHHARNPRSKRYARLADLAWGPRVLLLTATPVHNRGRDLRALLALFLGSRAELLSDDQVRRFIVRRTVGTLGGSGLPEVGDPEWLAVSRDPDLLRAITEIPPAVPAADGSSAHALMLLGLIRAWSSSDAALRETLRRRLRRAASFVAALESGRKPDRRELATWPVVDDAIQLGFPELFSDGASLDLRDVRDALDRHSDGVREILRVLEREDRSIDGERMQHLASIRARHPTCPVVAFTQFADTANASFRACVRQGGVAVVTGRGARIASGRASVHEIVRGFDLIERLATAGTMPLELLIATDVLSEGLSLRRAGVIVHLDLPWTIARLEQRVGRLRRLGSPYRRIGVYAIGPPVESRELVSVVRALQRKARLSSALVGDEELQSARPLLGSRLRRATAEIMVRGDANAAEQLRVILSSWTDATPAIVETGSIEKRFAGIGLIGSDSVHQLVAVTSSGVSDRPADVLREARRLGVACFLSTDPLSAEVVRARASIEQWLAEERGRGIARPAVDQPSAAHVVVLRALQETLRSATRFERGALAARVERCRRLVISARGIGAEMALARLSEQATVDLDALERLFDARRAHGDHPPTTARLVALICLDPDPGGTVSAFVSAC